jgi:hypothetical protein
MYLLFVGIDAGWHINRYFEIFAGGSVIPFVWANSLDNHFYNPYPGSGMQFYDSMESGFGWTAQLSGLFYPSFAADRFAFKLNIHYESLITNSGTSSEGAIGTGIDAKLVDKGAGSKIESDLWALSAGIVWFP